MNQFLQSHLTSIIRAQERNTKMEDNWKNAKH